MEQLRFTQMPMLLHRHHLGQCDINNGRREGNMRRDTAAAADWDVEVFFMSWRLYQKVNQAML
jgi:hypothetical protein